VIWFDVDGCRHYLAAHQGSSLPSRKTIYRLVAQGMRVARAEQSPGRKRGGSRMFFCPEWIDAFLCGRATAGGAQIDAPIETTETSPAAVSADTGSVSRADFSGARVPCMAIKEPDDAGVGI